MRDSQLQESGQQILESGSDYSAFLKYRQKPAPTTFSKKALDFHSSAYSKTQPTQPILVDENDKMRAYNTQFDEKLAKPGQFEENFDK